MKKIGVIISVLFCFFESFAQHNYTAYNAHVSIVDAIRVQSELIEGRTSFFEKQAAQKPLMFQKTKVRVGELNRLSNNLSKYIERIQKEVGTESILYDLLGKEAYKNSIFKSNGRLTYKGTKLKRKIDSLYDCSLKINVHKLSQLENFYEGRFNTHKEYFDFDQNKIDYFNHLFYDKSNYGMMMAMNYLLLDVKTFQLLYYGTVMSY
ncbi:GldM_N domain-containing protein [Tenacibaculum sp. 190130A14a]|uniref:GldM_N domain-containing protein n=1 Tax=Tenacibaculum polynesiense TaxID=3137857 RepID=A0ABM9PAV5_9FLAO